jgi:hypothetical protein
LGSGSYWEGRLEPDHRNKRRQGMGDDGDPRVLVREPLARLPCRVGSALWVLPWTSS